MSVILPVATLLIAFILVFSFSILVTSLMRVRNLPAYLLSLYILSISNIVFVSEIAGLLGLLRNQLLFLAVHLVLSALSFLVWWRTGRPALFEPISRVFTRYQWNDLRLSIKEWPDLWSLAVAVGIFYWFGAFLILKVPPNNWDGMTSHMARIGYWLQHGNFWPWPTWDYTQAVYPINAQVQMMWTILFWGWDQLAGFPQWTAALAGMIAIFGLGRLLGWTRPQSAYAGLIWALLPDILLQSTTVQNHLMAGVLFACALYFLFLGIRFESNSMLILSGFALALSLGTHQLAFFALPGLLVTGILIWLKYGRRVFKPLLIWGATSLVALLLVGSFMYIVNFSLYGHPFDQPAGTQPAGIQLPGTQPAYSVSEAVNITNLDFIRGVVKNSLRYIYSSFDTTGLDPTLAGVAMQNRLQIGNYLNTIKLPIAGNGFFLNYWTPLVNEDTAWFGITGFLLFPPLLLIQVGRGIITRDPLRLGIVIIFIGYAMVWSGIIIGRYGTWSNYQGRYFIILATLLAPFIAAILRPGRFFGFLSWLLVITSIILAISSTVYNSAKPLTGSRAIWTKSRIDKQDIATGLFTTAMTQIEKHVPSNGTLGLLLPPGFWEYPFFGKRLTRNLVHIYPDTRLGDKNWISENGIDWILLCKPLPLPQGFIEISNFNSWFRDCQLLQRAP
jgi:hypothetical protein